MSLTKKTSPFAYISKHIKGIKRSLSVTISQPTTNNYISGGTRQITTTITTSIS